MAGIQVKQKGFKLELMKNFPSSNRHVTLQELLKVTVALV